MTYRNKKMSYNNSRDIWQWYLVIPICIPGKLIGPNDYIFGKIVMSLLNLPCDDVTKGHVTQWLHAISSFPPNLVYMYFLKLQHNNIKNW